MNGLNDIVGQDAKEAGKWFSRDNLFLNSDFTHAVNQSGRTEFTTSGHTFDGWYSNCNEEYPTTINENGVKVLSNRSFSQKIEASKIDKSKTYTVSVIFSDGTLAYGSFVFPETEFTYVNITDDGWRTSAYAERKGYCGVHIYKWNANTDLYACVAKLEKGPTQTLAHRENGVWVLNRTTRYEDELRRCQEQYINTTSDLNSPYALQAVNSYTLFGSVTFPVEMRITPVMRNLTLRRAADGTIIQTTSAVLQGGPKGLYAITGIQPANLVVGEWYQLMCEFDARL